MKLPVYSMRDIKVGFMQPYVDQNDQTAMRGFSYTLSNRDGIMNFAPADYQLYKIGEFDTNSGKIEGCLPELIMDGTSTL